MKKLVIIFLFCILLTSSVSAYKIYYYHNDNQGNPVAITNEDGEVVWSVDYEPFGSVFDEEEIETTNKYTYNSKELNKNTKLLYYGNRFYDSEIGRFTTADTMKGTLENPQSLNRYSYVLNNPLKYIDPTGNQDEIIRGQLKAQEGVFGQRTGPDNRLSSPDLNEIINDYNEDEEFFNTKIQGLADILYELQEESSIPDFFRMSKEEIVKTIENEIITNVKSNFIKESEEIPIETNEIYEFKFKEPKFSYETDLGRFSISYDFKKGYKGDVGLFFNSGNLISGVLIGKDLKPRYGLKHRFNNLDFIVSYGGKFDTLLFTILLKKL